MDRSRGPRGQVHGPGMKRRRRPITPVSTLSHEESLQRGYRLTHGLPDTLAHSVPTAEQQHVNAVLCTLHLGVSGLSRGPDGELRLLAAC